MSERVRGDKNLQGVHRLQMPCLQMMRCTAMISGCTSALVSFCPGNIDREVAPQSLSRRVPGARLWPSHVACQRMAGGCVSVELFTVPPTALGVCHDAEPTSNTGHSLFQPNPACMYGVCILRVPVPGKQNHVHLFTS